MMKAPTRARLLSMRTISKLCTIHKFKAIAKAMPTAAPAAAIMKFGLKITHDGLPRRAQRAPNADLLAPLRHPITRQTDDSKCRHDEQREADAGQKDDEAMIATIGIGAHARHGPCLQ